MTGKQRAYLRGLANTLDAKYQIGKNGIEQNFIKTIDDALEANELIKVHVLETAFMDAREACEEVCESVGAYPVQCIGSKFVIYRESKSNKDIDIVKMKRLSDQPKKAPKKSPDKKDVSKGRKSSSDYSKKPYNAKGSSSKAKKSGRK